jgi:hypothetical protein
LKAINIFLASSIVVYWITMNSLVVLREREARSLDQYRAGVSEYLGPSLLRERWLGIYRKNRKIGYTGYTFEKVYALEGVEIQSTLESKMQFELLGISRKVEMDGNLVLDGNMLPLRLQLDISFEGVASLSVLGALRGNQFVLTVKQGKVSLLEIPLPREELHLGNGLVPALPVAGFKVGETFKVPCFDPITMSRAVASVKVVSKGAREIDGFNADIFCLETTFRGITSKSWVTGAGELVRQEFGPPLDDLVLRRDTRDGARRAFQR